jgi:hypothetical protein
MPITKALITAANPFQRTLPLQTIIDQRGESKSALQVLLEEAAGAGVNEFCVVVCPGDEAAYAGACGALRSQVRFVAQREASGYGRAILCGREFVGDQPFLHLVGDHLPVAQGTTSCARQLVDVAAADYTDNLPGQCLHPVGHWFEVPNLLKNGTLARLLAVQPDLRTLLVHNIDTLGATLDPALLGWFLQSGAAFGWEVVGRRIEDHGGGLARIDGRLRLVEGLALPREDDEFVLTYYNSNTCWVDIDRLLDLFGLTRAELADEARTTTAVRAMAARVPTYVTLKDVKKRWGHGQEDVFPVAQFEKLWGDMTALPDAASVFAAVPRLRGQQLKDQAQLDGWVRDGSAGHIESLCEW